MNRTVEARLKPGVNWRDMHILAEKILLSGLKDLGILKGDVNEMVEKRVGYLFMPHGLGHLMGIDVHDVGGYLKGMPKRATLPGLMNLRTSRNMEKGLVITVEPGCYFIDFLLKDGAELLKIPTSYIDSEKVIVGERIDKTLYEDGRSKNRG
jgi:Xaa-Pro dipeptidase